MFSREQSDHFKKEIRSCYFSALCSPKTFNYTLNKNQSPFPELVSDCLLNPFSTTLFTCLLYVSHPYFLAVLHMCWHILIFGPLFCCFSVPGMLSPDNAYGPVSISFRSLLRYCLLREAFFDHFTKTVPFSHYFSLPCFIIYCIVDPWTIQA